MPVLADIDIEIRTKKAISISDDKFYEIKSALASGNNVNLLNKNYRVSQIYEDFGTPFIKITLIEIPEQQNDEQVKQ